MQHREHARFFGSLKHLEDRGIGGINRRSFVGHKKFDRGDARFGKGRNFIEHPLLKIHNHGVETVIHNGHVIGFFLTMLGNRIQQAHPRSLRRKIYDRRRSPHGGGGRSGKSCRLRAHEGKAEMRVAVDAAGEDIFPLCVDHLICPGLKAAADHCDLLILDQDVASIDFRCGYNRTSFDVSSFTPDS